MSIVLRRATVEDLEEIHAMEIECYAEDAFSKKLLEYFLRSLDCVSLIAFLSGQAAGFIIGSIKPSDEKLVGRIYTLDVKRDHRRRGVGSHLLVALENVLAEKGVEACYLEVRVENVAAKRLYTRHGYEPIETLRGYYGFGDDGIRLRKSLRPGRQRLGQ